MNLRKEEKGLRESIAGESVQEISEGPRGGGARPLVDEGHTHPPLVGPQGGGAPP